MCARRRKSFRPVEHARAVCNIDEETLPLFFINIIECWYSKSFGVVRWGGAYSEKFSLRAGTRQGGVLSPALFSVCIDDLLCKLTSSGFGCCIRQQFFSACMFADDILLLSISLADLQQLLYICYDEL